MTDGQLNVVLSGDGRVNAIAVGQLDAPANLRVAQQRLRPTPSVSISWDAATGTESYRVYRAAEGTSKFEPIGVSMETEYTDGTIELGLSYTYAVVTVAGGGILESERSDPLTVHVLDPTVTPPAAPTGLRLATSLQHDTFTLRLDKVKAASSYYVYRASSPDGPFTKVDATGSPWYTLYEAPSTPCCYAFSYRVVAVNDGGLSDPSTAVTVSLSP